MYLLISQKFSILIIVICSIVSVDCSKKSSSSSSNSCQVSRGKGRIDSAEQLRQAMQSAKPGTVIELAAVDIDGSFEANRGGSSDEKVVITGTSECGRHTKIKGGLTLNGASNVVVRSLVFEDTKNALTINNANNVDVVSLIINSISGDAIKITGSSNNIKLRSNIISDVKGKGIAIEGTSQPVSLISNTITNTGGPSIALGPGVSNGQIYRNQFEGNGVAWVTIDGNNFDVTQNTGSGSVDNGFLFNGCGIKFSRNICELDRSNSYCIRAQNKAPDCCVRVAKSNISSGGRGLGTGSGSSSCSGIGSGSGTGTGTGTGSGSGSESGTGSETETKTEPETINPSPSPA